MTIEFRLPDLGENIEAADVANVLVAEGDVIQPEQDVLELETDKAVVELPCPHKGRVVKVHVKPGDRIKVGAPLLTIEAEAAAPSAPGAPKAEAPKPERAREELRRPVETPLPVEAPAKPDEPAMAETPSAPEPLPEPPPSAAVPRDAQRLPAPAGPATRHLARELGVDLHQLSGSGPGGRITAEDIHAYVRRIAAAAMAGGPQPGALAAAPGLPDFSQWGPVEREPMSGIRRKTAENVSLAWRLVPQVTQQDVADITELEAIRKRFEEDRGGTGGKITLTVLALKAAVAALKAFPQFNASLDPAAGVIIKKKYYHLGVAVDTEHGLIVPVLRDVDRKSIPALAAELEDLARRARERKVALEELRGGSFTITNLGGIGGTAFTPIVNYPEVAILGLARARHEPAAIEGSAQIRFMLPLCLSYDHRVIDGADGARFLRKVAQILSDPMRLLLEG